MKKKYLILIIISILLISSICTLIFIFTNRNKSKTIVNPITLSLSDINGPFISIHNNNLKNYIAKNNIITNIKLEEIIKNNYISNFYAENNNIDYKKNLKTYLNEQIGGKWNIIDSLQLKEGLNLFSNAILNINLNQEFEENENYYGITENTNPIIIRKIRCDYNNNNSFACSFIDNNNNTIIYMKDIGFKTYKEAFEYYKNNQCYQKLLIEGLDSVIFKKINIEQLDIFDIDNVGTYHTNTIVKTTLNNKSNTLLSLNKNYTYNFCNNSIIFIIKDGESLPYFAYKY